MAQEYGNSWSDVFAAFLVLFDLKTCLQKKRWYELWVLCAAAPSRSAATVLQLTDHQTVA